MLYAIVDVETTGGNALSDRITEIAIYLHDGQKVVDEFVSLINPERSIPPFITKLTGIDDEMVKDAPRFFEVAKDIINFTGNATLVAHNAQFDYSFIRQEYKSLGYNFTRDYLCTVRMSRKLIPGFRSYSLGNLCSQLGIQIENRHRAAGDALATVRLLELLLDKDDPEKTIPQFIRNDYLHLRFPPEFDRTKLDKLPDSPGVYYLHNDDGSVIYIGKSNNIRKRILSHFNNKETRKSLELRNSIRDITFEECGNELIALLYESDEIKRYQPHYNRALRNTFFNHGIFQWVNEDGYICLKPGRVKPKDEAVITTHSPEESRELIEKMISKYSLCQKLCGMYDISHACFHYSIRKCQGACIGKEPVDDYNERVQLALNSLQYKHPSFMIIGTGRNPGEKSVVHVEHGKYLGYGYFDPEFIPGDIHNLRDVIKSKQDNRDIHRILRSYLLHAPGYTVVPYEAGNHSEKVIFEV